MIEFLKEYYNCYSFIHINSEIFYLHIVVTYNNERVVHRINNIISTHK